MTTYARHKAAGQCPSCRGARDTPGRLHCHACRERQRRLDAHRLVVHYTSDIPIATPSFCQPLRRGIVATTRDPARVTCTLCVRKRERWGHTAGAGE